MDKNIYTIAGEVLDTDGTRVSVFDLAEGRDAMNGREALELINSYVACLMIGGGTATFDKANDRYVIVRADGCTEHVYWPFVPVSCR